MVINHTIVLRGNRELNDGVSNKDTLLINVTAKEKVKDNINLRKYVIILKMVNAKKVLFASFLIKSFLNKKLYSKIINNSNKQLTNNKSLCLIK